MCIRENASVVKHRQNTYVCVHSAVEFITDDSILYEQNNFAKQNLLKVLCCMAEDALRYPYKSEVNLCHLLCIH